MELNINFFLKKTIGLQIRDISSFVSDYPDLSEYYVECLVIKSGTTLLSNNEIESLKLLDNISEDSKTKCVCIVKI